MCRNQLFTLQSKLWTPKGTWAKKHFQFQDIKTFKSPSIHFVSSCHLKSCITLGIDLYFECCNKRVKMSDALRTNDPMESHVTAFLSRHSSVAAFEKEVSPPSIHFRPSVRLHVKVNEVYHSVFFQYETQKRFWNASVMRLLAAGWTAAAGYK